jgi:hypothetical protein
VAGLDPRFLVLVGSGPVGGGLVGSGLLVSGGWGVRCDSFVSDISDIPGVSISDVIGDNLGAAVGKEDAIATVGGIAVALLIGSKVDSGVIVLHGVLVAIGSGGVLVLGLVVSGGGLVRGGLVGSGTVLSRPGGSGDGHEGKECDEGLEGGEEENVRHMNRRGSLLLH